jgi:hypothetical protein
MGALRSGPWGRPNVVPRYRKRSARRSPCGGRPIAPAPGVRRAFGRGQSASTRQFALLAVSLTARDGEADDLVGLEEAVAALADPDIRTASVRGWDAARCALPNRPTCCAHTWRTEWVASATRRTRRTAREAVEDGARRLRPRHYGDGRPALGNRPARAPPGTWHRRVSGAGQPANRTGPRCRPPTRSRAPTGLGPIPEGLCRPASN